MWISITDENRQNRATNFFVAFTGVFISGKRIQIQYCYKIFSFLYSFVQTSSSLPSLSSLPRFLSFLFYFFFSQQFYYSFLPCILYYFWFSPLFSLSHAAFLSSREDNSEWWNKYRIEIEIAFQFPHEWRKRWKSKLESEFFPFLPFSLSLSLHIRHLRSLVFFTRLYKKFNAKSYKCNVFYLKIDNRLVKSLVFGLPLSLSLSLSNPRSKLGKNQRREGESSRSIWHRMHFIFYHSKFCSPANKSEMGKNFIERGRNDWRPRTRKCFKQNEMLNVFAFNSTKISLLSLSFDNNTRVQTFSSWKCAVKYNNTH